jgi:hypothetical protein
MNEQRSDPKMEGRNKEPEYRYQGENFGVDLILFLTVILHQPLDQALRCPTHLAFRLEARFFELLGNFMDKIKSKPIPNSISSKIPEIQKALGIIPPTEIPEYWRKE